MKPSTSVDAAHTTPADAPSADDSAQLAPPLPSRVARSRSKPGWAVTLEWVVLVVSALAIALLIKTFLFQAFYIPSDSMVPTLKTNDRVIVNKLSYDLHAVHRADIVVFKAPPGVDPSVKDLVKRVIGLPGETIEGRKDGHVYVNGKPLRESYLPKGIDEGPPFSAITIPANSYWVMGDNRSNSRDSRYFPNHFIRRSDIVGRVFLRIWPLKRLAIL